MSLKMYWDETFFNLEDQVISLFWEKSHSLHILFPLKVNCLDLFLSLWATAYGVTQSQTDTTEAT